LIPTATEDKLGSDLWGLGPTVVALKQEGPWTIGGLANHIWSIGSNDSSDEKVRRNPNLPGLTDSASINATFIQPFLSYVTETKTTLTLNTESTYDWTSSQWSIPLNFLISQMIPAGGKPVQLGVGVRYWAESTDAGAEGWGARVQLTFLFPK